MRILIVMAMSLLCACNVNAVREDVVGTWKATGPTYTSTLTLRPDGTFEEKHVDSASDETLGGTWTLERDSRRSYVSLDYVDVRNGSKIDRGVAGHTVQRRLNEIVLDVDPDADIYYRRLERTRVD